MNKFRQVIGFVTPDLSDPSPSGLSQEAQDIAFYPAIVLASAALIWIFVEWLNARKVLKPTRDINDDLKTHEKY